MDWRRLFGLTSAALFALSLLPALGQAQGGGGVGAATAEIEAELLHVLHTQGAADFFVVMAEKADLSAAYEIEDWSARGWYVYNTLTEVAARSQVPVIKYAEENGLDYQSFFTINAVYIRGGDLDAAQDLAALPGAHRLRLERHTEIDPNTMVQVPVGRPEAYGWNLDTLNPASNQYGMQAAQVWAQHSVRGDGIVVANIDTGAYYQHEALVEQYRGNLGGGTFDHDFNWYMPTSGCGDGTYPCDDNGHGSGTMGIMAGQTPDLVEQIGVAPGSRWIACKGCESSTCTEAALTACADWMVAPCPIGDPPGSDTCDPDMRPHVINNSWGGAGCDTWYQGYVQAWAAAGIFPAFSLGSTVACGALGSPGDNPEAFGTAAHDSTGDNLYAGGPSCFFSNPSCDPDAHQVDPHLNAPTFGRTAGNDPGEYYNLGGTSGASPHTAGTVALIWSGNPGYIGDILGTFTILEQSANHNVPAGSCGKPACAESNVYPNYEYGWGYLDALAAVTLAGVSGRGALEGTITEAAPLAAPGDPLPGINVTAERLGGGGKTTTTDASGHYTTTLVHGTYTVTATGSRHTAATVTGVVIVTNSVETLDFALAPKGLLYGYVTDADSGAPLEATVTANGLAAPTDPATGYYSMYLDAGTYDVLAEATDYASQTVQITIDAGQLLQQDLALVAALAVAPDPIALTLELGTTGSAAAVMTNHMAVDYPFQFVELGAPDGVALALADILLLGDDVADWQPYRDALDAAGATWDEWNLDTLPFPTPAGLAPYAVLIVFDESTLAYGDAECQSLADWLTSGGKSLFATSVDWLWDLENGAPGAGEHNLYLLFETEYQGDNADSTILDMDGVSGDVIGGSFAPPNTLTLAGSSDSSGDYADQNASAAATGLLYGAGGSGSGYAGLTHYADGNYKAVWLGANFHNGLADAAQRDELMSNILGFFLGGDVAWYGTSVVSGTVAAGTDLDWTNHFTATPAAGIDQPGDYHARLRIRPRSALRQGLPTRDVDVVLTVLPSVTLGKLQGTVSSERTGGPLAAEIRIEDSLGMTWTVTTDPASGYYSYWLAEGAYDVTASASGYASETVAVSLAASMTTTQDFALALLAPDVEVAPLRMAETLQLGGASTQTLTISNTGMLPLDFQLGERDRGFLPLDLGTQGVGAVQILFDNTHGGSTASYAEMIADLTAHGASVEVLTAGPIDLMVLADYDVLWVPDNLYTPFSPDELSDIEAWVHGGGGLFINYECCDDGAAPALAARFGIVYMGHTPGGGGVTPNIYPHPTTEGVTAVNLPDPYQYLTLAGTAEIVVDDVDNNGQVAANEVGGRVVVVDDDAFDDGTYMTHDNALLAMNILGWLAASDVLWLAEEPVSGTLPVDARVEIEVSFDAGVVTETGVYMADLRVRSNDPLEGEILVPVTMTVLPGGDIGKLDGSVTGTGYCDTDTYAAEAEILIENSSGMTWTSTSNPGNGYYYRWLHVGTYTVTASAPEHVPGSATVEVTAGQTTTQDFALRLVESCLDLTPLAFDLSLAPGARQTETLSLLNDGAGELLWKLRETAGPSGMVSEGTPAYGINLEDDSLVHWPDVAEPAAWSPFGALGDGAYYCGDFAGSNSGTLYVIDNDPPQTLYAVDTDTGTSNPIGPSPALAGQIWTGMAWDPTTAVMYGSATDGVTATLFTVDLGTAATTPIGAITGAPWTIDIAVDTSGQMYGHEIAIDSLVAIDKTTGAATVIGPTGFDANYAQGMDYDERSGLLYLTAYNNGSSAGELRIADTNIGATTLVGAFPDGARVDAFAIGGRQWVEVPWVSEAPTDGVTAPDSAFDVDVIFDTTGLAAGECYTANLGLIHDDPGSDSPTYLPLRLCIETSEAAQRYYLPIIVKNYQPQS